MRFSCPAKVFLTSNTLPGKVLIGSCIQRVRSHQLHSAFSIMSFISLFASLLLTSIVNGNQIFQSLDLPRPVVLLQSDSAQASVDHSEFWNVTYFPTYKEVWNTFVGEHYILYQRNTTKPPTSLYPNTTKIFEIPLRSVAVDETVGLTFLELLGLRTTIKYVGSLDFITSGCIRAMVDQGVARTLECSFTGCNATLREMQIADVDAFIGGNSPNPNPKSFAFSSTADPGPLHRAEWIEFFALFFNLEYEASVLFDGTILPPAFVEDLIREIARAVGVLETDIRIISLQPGSVIIEVAIDFRGNDPFARAFSAFTRKVSVDSTAFFTPEFNSRYGFSFISVPAGGTSGCDTHILDTCGLDSDCKTSDDRCNFLQDETDNWCEGTCYDGDCCTLNGGKVAGFVIGVMMGCLLFIIICWYGCYKMKSKPIGSTQSSMMKMDSVESVAEKGSTAEIQKNEVHRRRQLSTASLGVASAAEFKVEEVSAV
eukprot:jgi/Bigna1/86768/estExt_fgenesh1_pg.C_130207